MSIKILTKNSIDNTNIDGARQNHFSAGMRSGIVKGAFNEGKFFASASNIIALDSCELRISGHQVVIDSAETITLNDRPSTPTKYSMIAEIQVNDLSVPSFRLFIQPTNVELKKDNLFKTNNGKGTYQLRIGNFTLNTDGNITDVFRTTDIITGGNGAVSDIIFNASAIKLSADSEPEANVDYNEETGEYDFVVGIPVGSGSDVTLGGVVQKTWSADFAEAERQKSKNLYDASIDQSSSYGMTYSADTSKLYIDGTYTDGARCKFGTCSLKKGTYTLCIGFVSGSMTRFNTIKFMLYKGNSWTRYAGCPDISSNVRQVSVTFTLDEDVNDATLMLYQNLSNNTMTDCVFEYQIVSGSVADFDFQSYNGAIVHEKEFKEISSSKEILYNIYNDFINITESSLTTLQEYFDLFNLDKNKTYTCNIGALESSNFKNLVGKPTGFVNYVNCLIKNVVIGSGNIERNTTYQLLALDRYANGVAIGYIYKDNNAIIQFTGWTIIGETSSSGGGTNSESSTLYINEFTTLNDALSYLKNNSIDYDNVLEMEVTIGTNMSGKQNKCSISSSGTTFETTSNYRAVDSGIYSFKHSKPENGFTYYGSSVTDPNTMMFYRLTISVSSDTGHYGVKIATKQQTLSSSSLIFLQTSENLILEHVDSGDVGKVTNVKIVYIK